MTTVTGARRRSSNDENVLRIATVEEPLVLLAADLCEWSGRKWGLTSVPA